MTYKIKYDIPNEVGNFTKEEILKEGKGGTDAFMFISMLYPEDGSFSMKLLTKDGRTNDDLDPAEIWKVWSMMARQLAEMEELSPGKRELCGAVFKTIQQAILSK